MNTNKSQFEKVKAVALSHARSLFVPIRAHSWISFLLIGGALVGCRRSDMSEQPRYKPYQNTDTFADGASARALVPGTIVWHQPRTDELLYQGTINGIVANEFPFKITKMDMERGQQQFNIFCSACHGQTGEGNGMIVQRGLTPPPSYHIDRLRNAPVGHFFLMISNGQGAMYGYAERIKPEDRWRIAAYIRALQLSQNAKPAILNDGDKDLIGSSTDSVDPKELQGYTGPRGKVGVDQ
jgi:mono/diheme cytochrome c family protein